MSPHRNRWRERSLWQAGLGGARRTALAMRDVPERHDRSERACGARGR
jgi:hypothetical protein